jgi:hypothetical protein
VYGISLLMNRDLTDLAALSGLAVNEFMARILKHTLKQPRPAGRCLRTISMIRNAVCIYVSPSAD